MSSVAQRPPFRALWRESHAKSAILAALAASVPAAVAAVATMILGDELLGRSPLTVLSAAGGPLRILVASAAFAAVWGILVAFTAHHLAPLAGALWGSLYGVAVWLVGFLLLSPWVAPQLSAVTPLRLGLLLHLAWGATLGALFHVVRVTERRRHLRGRQ